MLSFKTIYISLALATSFSAGIFLDNIVDGIPSKIISQEKAASATDDWGTFITYTDDQTETYSTENMLTGVAVINPGMEVHPPHLHSEEEFLIVLEGTGTWNLNGKELPAKKGDLLYAYPGDLHGITNTGTDTLKFFVVKWNGKGVEKPDVDK